MPIHNEECQVEALVEGLRTMQFSQRKRCIVCCGFGHSLQGGNCPSLRSYKDASRPQLTYFKGEFFKQNSSKASKIGRHSIQNHMYVVFTGNYSPMLAETQVAKIRTVDALIQCCYDLMGKLPLDNQPEVDASDIYISNQENTALSEYIQVELQKKKMQIWAVSPWKQRLIRVEALRNGLYSLVYFACYAFI